MRPTSRKLDIRLYQISFETKGNIKKLINVRSNKKKGEAKYLPHKKLELSLAKLRIEPHLQITSKDIEFQGQITLTQNRSSAIVKSILR